MDYTQYLPHIEDSIDTLLDNFQIELLQKTTQQRVLEIRKELKIYLEHFKKLKIRIQIK